MYNKYIEVIKNNIKLHPNNWFFKNNKDYFKYYGGDMETLLSKCKYSHSRNLLDNHNKIHRILDRNDFLAGFELYCKNPEIEKRKETPKYLSFYTSRVLNSLI